MHQNAIRGLEQAGVLPLGSRRQSGPNVNLRSGRDHRQAARRDLQLRVHRAVEYLQANGFRAQVTPGHNIWIIEEPDEADTVRVLAEVCRKFEISLERSGVQR